MRTGRRALLKGAAAAAGAFALPARAEAGPGPKLNQFAHGDVALGEGPARAQFDATRAALLAMDEDALLKPFRMRAGLPAPGRGLGGWYDWAEDRFVPGTDMHGFIPGHALGQYLSALARMHAVTGDPAARGKVERLVAGFAPTITPEFYEGYNLPAYTFDKIAVGLIDAHAHARVPGALALLDRATDAALPRLPEKALTRAEMRARPHANEAWTWDESYTLPENLYRAWELGAGDRYRILARRYHHDQPYFLPLAAGSNVLPGNHAYSHVNALASAMKAWEVDGAPHHLAAAANGMRFVEEQSYATGGWGPNEAFVEPGKGRLGKLLGDGHASFETPCGCYGHFKVARALIAATGESHWGDAMERLFFNAALASLPLRSDGGAFYYSNYQDGASKSWFEYNCPCCSGTIGQLVADYGISSYLHDAGGVYVNLYHPSSVRWNAGGVPVRIAQSGSYPFGPDVTLTVDPRRAARFALRLRIPAWAGAATTLAVNDAPVPQPTPGRFAEIAREWRPGDTVKLRLDLPLRLEPVDAQTPRRVALVHGPIALFQTGTRMIPFRRAELLAARPAGDGTWEVASDSGPKRFAPFTAIGPGEPTRLYQMVAD